MFLYKMEENWFKEQAGLKKILVKYRKYFYASLHVSEHPK